MTSIATLEDIVAQIGIAAAESRKEWDERQKRWDEAAAERHKHLEDSLDKWVGRFGDKIGELIERILIPGIMPKMNEYGYNFTTLGPNKEFYLGKGGRRFAEVDLFLENGAEVMAVEVKTRLTKDDVEYHLKRLKLLRDNEAVSGLTGKTLYSAMAGLDIDDDARDMVLNRGMFLIEMVEDTKYVNIIKPPVPLGTW